MMKILHIKAEFREQVRLNKAAIGRLAPPVGLFSSVQYSHSLPLISKQLMLAGKKVKLFRGRCGMKGEVLGCDIRRYNAIKSILYIGDGTFHPLALAVKNHAQVFCFNPFSRKFFKLDQQSVDKYRKKTETGIKSYLMSERIGVLVSLKPGQCRLNEALSVRMPGKKRYILVADGLRLAELESFSFLQCLVNTACPRLAFDLSPKPIVNLDELVASGAVKS